MAIFNVPPLSSFPKLPSCPVSGTSCVVVVGGKRLYGGDGPRGVGTAGVVEVATIVGSGELAEVAEATGFDGGMRVSKGGSWAIIDSCNVWNWSTQMSRVLQRYE